MSKKLGKSLSIQDWHLMRLYIHVVLLTSMAFDATFYKRIGNIEVREDPPSIFVRRNNNRAGNETIRHNSADSVPIADLIIGFPLSECHALRNRLSNRA